MSLASRHLKGLLVLLLLIAMGHIAVASQYQVRVSTDKAEYSPGDSVTVSVSIQPAATVVLLWEVKDPNGARRDFGQVTCQGGSCSFGFRTGSNWPTGSYSLIVAVSGTDAKGYATFTLRKPEAPPPAPTPPAPAPAAIDYEFMARVQIAFATRSLNELNATLVVLSSIMSQLNMSLNPEYAEQLRKIAATLSKAVESYNMKDYETAYNLATSAYQTITQLMESFLSDMIQTLRSIVSELLAKTRDEVTVELLNVVDRELAGASLRDRDVLTKLAFTGRVLVVVARALKIPELEYALIELSRKAETLESIAKSLNQSNIDLQAQIAILQSEKTELIKQIEHLISVIDELKKEINKTKALNNELNNENLKLRVQLAQSLPQSTAIAAILFSFAAGAAVGVAFGRLLAKKKARG